MDIHNSIDGFVPYESFDSIYSERKLPEFGQVDSSRVRVLDSWNFFLAQTEADMPFGFESASFDDSEWDIINTPSTWQTEGYGLPQALLYNYPSRLRELSRRGEESIYDKFYLHSSNADSDESGIYRTSVVFSEADIDRALYLEFSGISGSFEIFLNGQQLVASHAVSTPHKVLLSDCARVGINQIAIVVHRWDRDRHGRIIRELMNFGFSGIYRPIRIISESLLELSDFSVVVREASAGFINQLTDLVATDRDSAARVGRGDYEVSIKLGLRNHTDLVLPYSIRTTLMEVRGEYDPYKLPKVDIKPVTSGGGTVSAGEYTEDSISFIAPGVSEWTDSSPVLYDIIIELLDSEERTICVKKRRFGFRTASVSMDRFHINDKAVALKLVRYYEFDPRGGICVPRDLFRHDIILMKRCGVNGIVTQGFQISEEMLNLCDEYGIYVIANVCGRYIADYVRAVHFHPCVIMWSIDEYGYEADEARKLKEACSAIDPTRPWYCSEDYDHVVSDLTPFPSDSGVIFGPWCDLCLDRASIFSRNKLGVNLFTTIPGRTHFPDDGADYKWIHHADLVGGKYKANSSIGQGIVDSERNPHPIYQDIKKQCQVISVFSSPDDSSAITLRNTHTFEYTPEALLVWRVIIGGVVVLSGKGNIPAIEPLGIKNLRFPIDVDKYLTPGWGEGRADLDAMYRTSLSHEIVFDISIRLSRDTYFASEGYEIAFYQEVLSGDCADPSAATVGAGFLPGAAPGAVTVLGNSTVGADCSDSTDDLTLSMNAVGVERLPEDEEVPLISNLDILEIGSPENGFRFNRRTGAVSGIIINGEEFLAGSIMPSFYRCPSNIDRTDRSFILARTIFSKETDYESIQNSISFTGCTYGSSDDRLTIISHYSSFAVKGEILISYEIVSSRKMIISMKFVPRYDLVRYGLRMPVVRNDNICTWYGRGPGESYYDRKNATRIGLYSAGVDKIYHSYARPAENSNHCDTHAMQISNLRGDSVRFTRRINSEPATFEFTLVPYTPEQMNEQLHEELLLENDFCMLFLDFCTKEIERTETNETALPLKKNVLYEDSFEVELIPRAD